jgi:hypothetical protein
MKLNQGTTLAAVLLGLASTASAAEILVTNNISVSTTWTSNNTYNLQNQIYVLPGATLTIEAGTVVASTPSANGSGSLAVTKGAQIMVLGTKESPVIMTSTADVATWTGADPKTGAWREAANEWGNLTLMGAAFISEDATAGNVPTCNANNVAAMEGLTPDFAGDTKVLYGGGNDDDDSGEIRYLSIRYGGRVIGLANELNGLSLGGIGRGTDLHHIEIMNNVDDGIEIWGGTFNLSHFSIWNVGDDSLDVDQGYRGQIQFGLIVQGYSLDAPQGSGVGDNCLETDGAEDSDWQPVTTTCMYNLTVIGQPLDGDGATTWRDNARVQYRNCVFMDCGENVVRFDNIDGDGGNGYGHNGTLSWLQTWQTPWNAVPPHANDCPPGIYAAQFSGNLSEIKDSVLFNNANYVEFNNVGANNPACNNVIEPIDSPIVQITRGAPVVKGGKAMVPVVSLDPRPASDALVSIAAAPANGFFTPAPYRGAFVPNVDGTWLGDWTASYAFGLTRKDGNERSGFPYCFGDGTGATCPCGANGSLGQGCANTTGSGAVLAGSGDASISNDTFQLSVTGIPGNKPGLVLRGASQLNSGAGLAIGDGLLCTSGSTARSDVHITMNGATTFTTFQGASSFGAFSYGAGIPTYYQFWYRDPQNPCTGAGFNFTNAWCVVWNL